MSSSAEIERQAAEWLMRREDSVWSADDQASLDDWLAVDPLHKVALWRLECGWEWAERISALGTATRRDENRRRRHLVLALVGAMAAGLVLAIGLWLVWTPAYEHETLVGERKTVALLDGSRMELNTSTRVRTHFADERREVWLESGEAYFDVAHDPSRPFVVHAGPRTITVLGTRFSVLRIGKAIRVAVADGRVAITDADRPSTAPPQWVIGRGDMAVVESGSLLLAPSSETKVDNALAWRRGMLTFDQMTLAEAASEFNRYNEKKLIISDPSVASIRIGGSFSALDAEAFAKLIERGFGLAVKDDGESIRISE